MNNNKIMELINKIEKKNFNKNKTQSKKPMNSIFKTNNKIKIKIHNDVNELLIATDKDKSYQTFINKKKKNIR
jgi:hypothetical protein